MRDKSIEGRNNQALPSSGSKPPLRLLNGGHDPRETGRKGGLARAANLSPDELSAIGRNAQLARTLKQKNQLNNLVGPAIRALKLALKSKDESALVKAATAVLDRTGHHTKSSIEIDGELTHSGELIHRTQCLDVDRLPLIVRRMMAAAIESDWQPSPELEAQIKAELPMLQLKLESSKKDNRSITNGSNGNGIGHSPGGIVPSINRAITAGAVAAAHEAVADQDDDQDDRTTT